MKYTNNDSYSFAVSAGEMVQLIKEIDDLYLKLSTHISNVNNAFASIPTFWKSASSDVFVLEAADDCTTLNNAVERLHTQKLKLEKIIDQYIKTEDLQKCENNLPSDIL